MFFCICHDISAAHMTYQFLTASKWYFRTELSSAHLIVNFLQTFISLLHSSSARKSQNLSPILMFPVSWQYIYIFLIFSWFIFNVSVLNISSNFCTAFTNNARISAVIYTTQIDHIHSLLLLDCKLCISAFSNTIPNRVADDACPCLNLCLVRKLLDNPTSILIIDPAPVSVIFVNCIFMSIPRPNITFRVGFIPLIFQQNFSRCKSFKPTHNASKARVWLITAELSTEYRRIWPYTYLK